MKTEIDYRTDVTGDARRALLGMRSWLTEDYMLTGGARKNDNAKATAWANPISLDKG